MNVLVEYKRPSCPNWLILIGAPGNSYHELVDYLQHEFADLEDVRPRWPMEVDNEGCG